METDYRKVSISTLEHTRMLALGRIQNGESLEVVTASRGLSRPTITTGWHYFEQGDGILSRCPKGKVVADKRNLMESK